MCNINEILEKDFKELTKEEERVCVEALYKRLQIEFRKSGRSGIYGYTQRNFAYNSNRIEGSRLSEEHTADLFETQAIRMNGSNELVASKDVEETNGHFAMFNSMLIQLGEPLSEDIIKKLHYELKIGVFEDRANGYTVGDYKTKRNIIGNYETTPPNEVSDRIRELIQDFNSGNNIDIRSLAKFHFEYESIHPFQDGNGRTGRILLFRECLRNGVLPFVVEDKFKQTYINSLTSGRVSGSLKELTAYFVEEQEMYFEQVKYFMYEYDVSKETQVCKYCRSELLSTGKCPNVNCK